MPGDPSWSRLSGDRHSPRAASAGLATRFPGAPPIEAIEPRGKSDPGSFGRGSKIDTLIGTLANGSKNSNLRSPGGLIYSHTHLGGPGIALERGEKPIGRSVHSPAHRQASEQTVSSICRLVSSICSHSCSASASRKECGNSPPALLYWG